jgi:hypothetical protein
MVRKLLLFGPALILLGCCGTEEASPTAPVAPRAPNAPAAKNEAPKAGQPAPDAAYGRWPTDFNLPLIIHIEAPEPPPEIVGPSPPIQEPAKPAETKATEKKPSQEKPEKM